MPCVHRRKIDKGREVCGSLLVNLLNSGIENVCGEIVSYFFVFFIITIFIYLFISLFISVREKAKGDITESYLQDISETTDDTDNIDKIHKSSHFIPLSALLILKPENHFYFFTTTKCTWYTATNLQSIPKILHFPNISPRRVGEKIKDLLKMPFYLMEPNYVPVPVWTSLGINKKYLKWKPKKAKYLC